MWFVWDGNARQGPYSEMEICRRIAMGQWPLSVCVRPESCLVYRPIVWMMPLWCKIEIPVEQTRGLGLAPNFHDATRIASLEPYQKQGIKPELEAQFLSLEPQDALAPDFQTDVRDSSSLGKAGNLHFGPETKAGERQRENKSDRQDFIHFELSAPLAASKSENVSKPEQGDEGIARPRERRELNFGKEIDSPNLMVRHPRKSRFGNQKPLMVSEGSVSLIDQKSATQIRIRRVNPTAPRRKSKSFAPRIPEFNRLLPRSWKVGNDVSSLLVVFSSVLALLFVIVLGFWLMGKRVPSARTQHEGSSPTQKKKVTQNTSKGEITTKKMSARQPSVDPGERKIKKLKSNIKGDVLSNSSDINSYLSATPPSQRKFVFVGPLTLVARPPDNCSPCQGSGRLPDGATVTLSSVTAEPWAKGTGVDEIYVRGFVIKTTKFIITVNAIRASPPR